MKGRRRSILKVALSTLLLVAAWSGLVIVAGLNGWGRMPLAGTGPGAFMAAARRVAADHPGNLGLVLIEDGRVFDEHFASTGRSVDRDTLFQVASVSKWITAWGVMALVEAGRLDLDAPVGAYLTRWRLPPGRFDNKEVTVRRLLSHTAGLTDGLGYCGFAPGQPMDTLEASLTRASDACPGSDGAVVAGAEPGAGWRYSGGGYTLLQLVVEEVTGEPFPAYMRRAVLAPLGMNRSTFETAAGNAENVATFYDSDGSEATHYRYTASAAASLYTSAADLTRFVQAHLPGPGGEPRGRGVLSPTTLEAMRRPHAAQYGADMWGLGLRLYTPNDAGSFIIGHDGGNAPAINTTARVDPASGDAIIALATGGSALASRLGSEWLFLRRGEVTALTIIGETYRLLPWIAGGSLLILFGGAAAGWRAQRRKPVQA